MTLLLVGVLALAGAQRGVDVTLEDGRFTIRCQSASLGDLLREVAEAAAIELWLDEGVADKRVSLDAADVVLQDALDELFEDESINYVVYQVDGRVEKLYVGGEGSGGRLPRAPTYAPEPPR